jgi:hypothetical protein
MELLNNISLDINPIIYLKLNKFQTGLKPFTSKNEIVNDDHNFKKCFPTLYDFISNFEKKLTDNPEIKNTLSEYFKNQDIETAKLIDSKINTLLISKLSEIEIEIIKYYGEEWNSLTHMDGKTKVHIVYSLVYVYYDITLNKQNISEYDENILLWSILLHDISKHVEMIPFEDFPEKW